MTDIERVRQALEISRQAGRLQALLQKRAPYYRTTPAELEGLLNKRAWYMDDNPMPEGCVAFVAALPGYNAIALLQRIPGDTTIELQEKKTGRWLAYGHFAGRRAERTVIVLRLADGIESVLDVVPGEFVVCEPVASLSKDILKRVQDGTVTVTAEEAIDLGFVYFEPTMSEAVVAEPR